MTASRTDHSLSETTTLIDDALDSWLTLFRIAVLIAGVHVALVAIQPTLSELLIVEAVVGVALVANELRETRSIERALALGLAFVAVGGSLWTALLQGIDLWLVTLSLLAGLGVLGYGFYRYQLVVHGNVGGADEY